MMLRYMSVQGATKLTNARNRLFRYHVSKFLTQILTQKYMLDVIQREGLSPAHRILFAFWAKRP